jgi:hypothetical protein
MLVSAQVKASKKADEHKQARQKGKAEHTARREGPKRSRGI